jgi:hypothetical protein
MTPTDLYRDCVLSAWRIETLQHYAGTGDEERQRAFHAGEPLPPPSPGKQDDLALVTRLVDARRTVGRIHIIDRPLTDYVRCELAVYAENAAAGESVRIVDRSAHPKLAEVGGDFAIFDAKTPDAVVILFAYDGAGLVRGYQVTSDKETVERCQGLLNVAYGWSVPLAEFAVGGG